MKKQSTKHTQNKYRNIIMERLASNEHTGSKKNNSLIHNLKTQCTPNNKTQEICEKVCEDFQEYFKMKYKPVTIVGKMKPAVRCLYPELLDIARNSIFKQDSSLSKSKKTRANTETAMFNPEKGVFKKIVVDLPKKQSKQSLDKQKRKSAQKKVNESDRIQRQNSLASLKSVKGAPIKRTQSIKDLNVRSKRCQTTVNDNFQGYTVKNLKTLTKNKKL